MATSQSSIIVSGGEPIEYRDIPGYFGYRIGTDASVWTSFNRASYTREPGFWRPLTIRRLPSGYLFVGLRRNKKSSIRYVHRLMLETFIGPCPPGMECCHFDGVRSNNSLSNLRWATRKENAADRARHGTLSAGDRHYAAVLTPAQVLEIRATFKRRDKHFGSVALGKKFGVGRTTIKEIVAGRNWKNLVMPLTG